MRQIVDRLCGLVPLSTWDRIERVAKRQRLGSRVPDEVVANVKAKKEASKSLRDGYRHDPRLAAIVTSFNQVWNVEQLAERLVSNEFVEEIVVSEDGSLDGSLESWVSRLEGPNHFVVRSNDLHEIRGLDRSIRLSRAEVKCIIQDDDVVPVGDQWAADAMALFDAHPRLGVLGGFFAFVQPPEPPGVDGEPNLSFWSTALNDSDSFRFVATVSVGPYYVRSECYESCGGFDTAFSAPGQAGVGFDEEFCLRAWRHGWQVGYLPQPFKTGEQGGYDFGAGGTFLYGDADERTTHDVNNKRLYAAMHGPFHDEIAEAIRRSNDELVRSDEISS